MNFVNYSLDDFLNDAYEFNTIAGNTSSSKEALLVQHKVLQEEVNEVLEAIENNDLENLAKEVTDVLYVACGFIQKLETLGVDMSSVVSEVAYNNLTKFTSREEVVQNSMTEFKKKGISTSAVLNEEFQVYVIKDSNGKVVKPANYKQARISEFIPAKNIWD